MDKSLPLYKQIQNHLREQILSGKLRPGDRVPSEMEIAEYFKVSQITSKQALTSLADEKLVVRIKGKGTFVAGRNRTDILSSMNLGFKGIVGIIFPSICMPVESLLFFHIQLLLHQHGYQTLIRVTEDDMDKEIEAIKMFHLFGVRGHVIFPVINESFNEEILKLSLTRFPHVLVDRYLPSLTSSSVSSENRTISKHTVQQLFSEGHQQIALITQLDSNSNTTERIAGIEDAYINQGLPVDKQNWLYVKRLTKKDDDEICERIKTFISKNPQVTAIVTIDAVLARLTYAALGQLGIQVPQQVKIVSYDNPKLPFVPYIEQNVLKIAETAVDIIIQQMEQEYIIRKEIIESIYVDQVNYPSPEGI